MSAQSGWQPARLRYRPLPVLLTWLETAAALLIAAWLLPGISIDGFGGALVTALLIAIFNAVLPPIAAALRIPFMAVLGFPHRPPPERSHAAPRLPDRRCAITVDNFGWALLAALVASAIGVALSVLLGTNDDDTYMLRMTRRIARRQGGGAVTDVPGLLFLEIDGLALPVLQRAMRDGSAPTLARWVDDGTHRLVEWEPDLSSQTGASQAGILLGSNQDIPAFRWVVKETGRVVACSGPQDCAEIEQERATGIGLLVNGGSSRGNLLSGEADEVILTCSRMSAETRANPGYRAFFANGLNVTRTFVLFFWEVVLEWTAALRAASRDVRPRGHRGGIYPFMRAAMCVVVRDLIVYGVISDMMFGRPVVYSTFSSYDEVAHHSGLERSDTLEALRKLDQQFDRIDRARRYAARPYLIVVLSDHGQTQGATFKQRNGYGLNELVERSLEDGRVEAIEGGDEQQDDDRSGARRGGRGDGEAAEVVQGDGRRPPGGRARLGQPRSRVPDGRAAAADAGRDRRTPSTVDRGAARAPARGLAARPLPGPRARSCSARGEHASWRAGRSRARTRSPSSRRRRRSICCAPTGSRTWPTSWSAASTTPSSRKAARSRS